MITYFQDGHTEDVPYFITDCMQFFIQDIGTSVDKYAYPNDSLKYDVDNEDEETLAVIDKYNVRNVPVIILEGDNGDELKKWVGLVSLNDINAEVEKNK